MQLGDCRRLKTAGVKKMLFNLRVHLQMRQKPGSDKLKAYERLLNKASKNEVLELLPALHDKAFAENNCLECARCCKNYSPRFKTPDIKRIASTLRMKESVFIDTYLRIDEDGDFVTKGSPCPFLQSDNKCGIYENRPSDCRRFPYTDEDVIIKRKQLTLKNASFCPIVDSVLSGLLTEFPKL
jgi:uncharacterized protein